MTMRPGSIRASRRAVLRAAGTMMLAGGAVATGALFNAGAFAQSGRIVRSKDRSLSLGWYGGFRRLGFALRPQLRAGLTGTLRSARRTASC